MREISPRFIGGFDPVSKRRRTSPEACELREYEPDPMPVLPPPPELGQSFGISPALRVDEPLEVEGIQFVHRLPSFRKCKIGTHPHLAGIEAGAHRRRRNGRR